MHNLKSVIKLSLWLTCFLWVSSVSYAEQTGATTAAPVTANQDVDPGRVYVGALEVLNQIDRNGLAVIWDNASELTRKTVTRDVFVKNVQSARSKVGSPTSRRWLAVTRQLVGKENPQLINNVFVSVSFASTFSNKQTLTELISFRLDSDGQWRFAGYAIQ